MTDMRLHTNPLPASHFARPRHGAPERSTEPARRHRVWASLTILLALAGCRDAIAPRVQEEAEAPRLDLVLDAGAQPHILRQAPWAPPLQTYQVSWWQRYDRETTIAVDYQPQAGQSAGQPFLRFHLPKFGMKWAPDGTRLSGGDSLLITLTMDTVSLAVDFQPSGIVFSEIFTPELAVSYANANPDLNGDGALDATDQLLELQLAIWSRETKTSSWSKLLSKKDLMQKYVASSIYHFSQYAVSY